MASAAAVCLGKGCPGGAQATKALGPTIPETLLATADEVIQ
jgi:hypothetical protein